MQVRTLLGFGISEDIGVGEYIDRHEDIGECSFWRSFIESCGPIDGFMATPSF